MVDRNVESYSQLREAAKQIIAKVAGRLSGVRLSGLMDPAVTGLERAAVVANTPITFRPRELLGVRVESRPSLFLFPPSRGKCFCVCLGTSPSAIVSRYAGEENPVVVLFL